VVVVFGVVLVGSLLQGVVGLGLGLLGTPVVTLLEPDLVPGLLLVLAMVLPLVTLTREHRGIDWHGLGWSLPSRVLGTGVGVWLVATVSDRVLSAGIALVVLAAVALTARALVVPLNRPTLVAAGLVSGVTGTTAAIGGPPIALLYQHRPPPEVRTTMAVYFTVGSALSLAALAATGELTGREVLLGLLLVPALVLGTLLAGPVRRRVDAAAFRVGMLVVCAVSALVLLVQALLGG